VGSVNEGYKLSTTEKYGRQHDKRELVLPFRQVWRGFVVADLCARRVPNLVGGAGDQKADWSVRLPRIHLVLIVLVRD
jgi:hypothetical protein